jgi:hypothetical protein
MSGEVDQEDAGVPREGGNLRAPKRQIAGPAVDENEGRLTVAEAFKVNADPVQRCELGGALSSVLAGSSPRVANLARESVRRAMRNTVLFLVMKTPLCR